MSSASPEPANESITAALTGFGTTFESRRLNWSTVMIRKRRTRHVELTARRRNAEIQNASAFDAVCEGPAAQSGATDVGLVHLIRETAGTIWHPTGTCRMGPGEGAVCA